MYCLNTPLKKNTENECFFLSCRSWGTCGILGRTYNIDTYVQILLFHLIDLGLSKSCFYLLAQLADV